MFTPGTYVASIFKQAGWDSTRGGEVLMNAINVDRWSRKMQFFTNLAAGMLPDGCTAVGEMALPGTRRWRSEPDFDCREAIVMHLLSWYESRTKACKSPNPRIRVPEKASRLRPNSALQRTPAALSLSTCVCIRWVAGSAEL